MAGDTHIRNQFVMPGRLVVEAEALPAVPDRVNADGHLDKPARSNTTWPLRRARRLPSRVVSWIGRILREGVQDVGDEQFLVLLLVMQADFENREDALGIRRWHIRNQAFDCRVDM